MLAIGLSSHRSHGMMVCDSAREAAAFTPRSLLGTALDTISAWRSGMSRHVDISFALWAHAKCQCARPSGCDKGSEGAAKKVESVRKLHNVHFLRLHVATPMCEAARAHGTRRIEPAGQQQEGYSRLTLGLAKSLILPRELIKVDDTPKVPTCSIVYRCILAFDGRPAGTTSPG